MIEVPISFQGKPAAVEASRLKALLTVIAAGWAIFCLQQIYREAYEVAAIDAGAFVFTALLSAWATSSGDERRLRSAAHLALVISSAAIAGVSLLSGQADAIASWYLTAVPLFAAYTLGIRPAMAWGAGAAALILLIYFSDQVMLFEPVYLPNSKTALISRLILLLTLLGLAVATRRATDHYGDALAQREKVIRERADELAEARDEALAAVRAKDRFLAHMSHEIRTPLNGIIGMTSILLDADQPEEQRGMLRTVQRSSNALLAILNEILDFSKLEASAVVLENIPLDLRECVEDAVDLLGRVAFEKGLDLYVHIDTEAPRWIEGDITYLRQVLLNLIGNAIKFTDEGEVCVRVSIDRLHRLHFRVCDTGIGIPEDKHELAFRSFSQVDTSTTREYGGTGLGLPISRRLVELMGGDLWFDSDPGVGSTFHFTIEAPEVEAPARPVVTDERITLIGHHVLLVGGGEGPRLAMSELLRSWGMRIELVESPADLTTSGDDVLVVFDDALASVVGLADRPPTLLLVPLSHTAARERANRIGIEAVVFRPMRQRALRQALEALISGEAVTATGAAFTAFDPTMGERLPARILIGEDNPVNQKVAVTVLEKLGYSPDAVYDGPEVLGALNRRDYDIIFLDLQMPGMDGIETTRAIRGRDTEHEPWIVALTASVGADQRARADEAGMNDFVSKPFDVQTLMAAIERWANSDGAAAGETSAVQSDESPWEQLCSMFDGAPDRLASLVEDHLDNGVQLVESIESALQSKEAGKLGVAAHTLKSSAAQFGSEAVAKIATQIEELAQAPRGTELELEVGRLRTEWQQAHARLARTAEELRDGGSVSPDRA